MIRAIHWLRKISNKSKHSVGFYPAIASLLFLLLFVFFYSAEESDIMRSVKQKFIWLNLKNTEAARTILSTIASGIIGLTVFSFSMVMVVMVQAASQMSNRMLDNLIGNRFQQITLSFYLGTIISSFFLLSVVDDKGTSHVPSISVFLLVLLSIVDLFLFVFFLHYVTQSVRFEHLIERIHQMTKKSFNNFIQHGWQRSWELEERQTIEVRSPQTGYFQGINQKQLLAFASRYNVQLEFYPLRCTYVLKGEPLLKMYYLQKVPEQNLDELYKSIDFYNGQEIDKNYFYGFIHLTEAGVKALSPGINDPNTAVLSIHALTDLLTSHLAEPPSLSLKDKDGVFRIYLRDRTFEELFCHCIYPIWDYGKKDRLVRQAFTQMVDQLQLFTISEKDKSVIKAFQQSLLEHNVQENIGNR